MSGRAIALALAAACAWTGVGCGLVLGIEDVVPREAATDTGNGGAGAGGSTTASTSASGAAGGGGDACSNMDQDGSETDVDCGGGRCAPCKDGEHCASGSDCESGVCERTICQAATCTDGVANGSETDVDCGGGSGCAQCGYGLLCEDTGDCAPPGACDRGVCAPDPIGVWQPAVDFPGENVLGFSMTYDAQSEVVLLFGGNGKSNALVADDWLFDGNTWSAVAGQAPAPRFYHAAAYSSATHKTLLFGGALEGIVLDDETWQFDGATQAWTQKTPVQKPTARWVHAMAYDVARDRFVLFGGRDGPFLVGDTWEWDGTDWSQVVPQMGLLPGARMGHKLVYDEQHQRVVLFGGEDPSMVALGDTWTYDGTQWSEVAAAQPSPPARTQHGMAYDSIRSRVVMFGGAEQTTPIPADTWEWDGASWKAIGSARLPPADYRGAMAFDASRARMVYRSGITPQTWEYFTLATPCFADAECGTGACAEHLCCSSACADPCHRCNDEAAPGTCTLVTNAEDPDSCAGDMHCDAAGQCVPD